MSDFNWRQHLKVHPAAEIFPPLSADELKELGADIKEHGLTSRIVLLPVQDDKTSHYELLDGVNRLDAMALAGLDLQKEFFDNPLAKLTVPPTTDPYDYVISANILRRHLSDEGRRNLIAKVLKAKPDLSDRAIGEQIKADHKTVARVRREAEGRGDIPHVKTRIDSKGRKQPATKAERKAISRDTGIDKKARMIWGWLTAVEKEGYLTTTPKKILQSMTSDMRADMHRLGLSVGQWLLTVSAAAGKPDGEAS
jgi:hypothetical protein